MGRGKTSPWFDGNQGERHGINRRVGRLFDAARVVGWAGELSRNASMRVACMANVMPVVSVEQSACELFRDEFCESNNALGCRLGDERCAVARNARTKRNNSAQ
jgi:hypothetical protein